MMLFVAALLCGCSTPTFDRSGKPNVSLPELTRTLNTALTWPAPAPIDALAGARVLLDGPRVSYPEIAIARAILHTNSRMAPAEALFLATTTVVAARRYNLVPEFFAATILQESAFDPNALSSAGAVGIAQFELETAAETGVDPFDPVSAIDGAAALLGGYVDDYRGRYDDPYACALAAYNAGPGAVSHYHGVPPYAETRAYVDVIYERWIRIAGYERRAENRPAERSR